MHIKLIKPQPKGDLLALKLHHTRLLVINSLLSRDIDLGQDWLRKWLAVWRRQAITWTNVDFLSVRFCGIHKESNFIASDQATILYNKFEISTCKIIATSPRGQWVRLLSGVPDYFDRNKISSGGDLSHYSSASLY